MSNHGLQFVGFFAAGLAVNLTPCVYPMLTVTASLFKPRDGQTLRHSFFKALAYFLGICVMFSSLGYFAASTGALFGSVLQNSWVLFAIAALMITLALSMFGILHLPQPVELMNKLGGMRQAGYLGLFASGMFVGVFAAPCCGPPILALLTVVAKSANPVFGFTAFFIFSCGMGLPYLLLGTFSSLLKKLPKAGNWLIVIERIFGVLLMGFGIFYLTLALHWQLPGNKSDVVWVPYSRGAVELSIMQHKPTVLDFYADWCISCHELERDVFSKPEIAKQLAQLRTLRVDATNQDDPAVQEILTQYGIIGLPTVIFLDSHGLEIKDTRVVGVSAIEEFAKSLAQLK